MTPDKDYVLGTHDEEIARLALQHRVWRPRASDAWRRAGFTTGQTILDIGCGPGNASIDLAEIVGSTGRVIAIDRSRRFLDALEATCALRGLFNIETHEIDLDHEGLPEIRGRRPKGNDAARVHGAAAAIDGADGAWSRWIFAFVKHPRELLARVAERLKPGGVFVLHEYFDYSTWRTAPRLPEHEEFVRVVMEAWRADGGEPDIALDLPRWLGELGFEIRELHPIIDVVPPASFQWQWPKSFIEVGLRRMTDLGRLTDERAVAIAEALARSEAMPHTLMITPAVLEIIAVRQGAGP